MALVGRGLRAHPSIVGPSVSADRRFGRQKHQPDAYGRGEHTGSPAPGDECVRESSSRKVWANKVARDEALLFGRRPDRPIILPHWRMLSGELIHGTQFKLLQPTSTLVVVTLKRAE